MTLLLRIASVFFKVGILTVGGGLAMIPIIQHEIVTRGWLTNQQFLDILGIAEMTPGPMSVNTATFVGYRIISTAQPGAFALACVGALVGTVAVSMPSLICINALGAFWRKYREHPCMVCVFSVLRPLVTGLVTVASVTLVVNSLWGDHFADVLKHAPNWAGLAILLASFSLSAWTRVSPFYLLIGGMAIGAVLL